MGGFTFSEQKKSCQSPPTNLSPRPARTNPSYTNEFPERTLDERESPFEPSARRARNRSSEHIPAPGPLGAGQLYFSNQIWTRLSVQQQTKLGAHKVGSKNKSFKTRPWLVVKVGEGEEEGKVWVMCCTTRNRSGWQGVTWRDSISFLPMSPTSREFNRPVLELLHDPREVFCGGSLLFLEVFKEVRANLLGDYIGQITPAALEIVIREKSSLDTTLSRRSQDCQRRFTRGNPRVGSALHDGEFSFNALIAFLLAISEKALWWKPGTV